MDEASAWAFLRAFAKLIAVEVAREMRGDAASVDPTNSPPGREPHAKAVRSDASTDAPSEPTAPNAGRHTHELIAILQSGGQLTEEEERRMRYRNELIAKLNAPKPAKR